MNTLFIILGIFFGISFLSSILVLSACVLSSRTGSELEGWEVEHEAAYEDDSQYEHGYVKESVTF